MAYSPSEKYPGAVDVDPDYQGGKFRDNNPSTTNNGSPLKAIDRNELLARDEAIMNDAGFKYNGLPDTPDDSQLFEAYKASLGNGANLLSNHNFLIQTPDDSQPLPSATPTSYPPGYQIFSDVFANETTGITNLTYIDGRVSFSGGDLHFAVPNTGAIARLTSDQLTASVADFDGKPRTRGVSFALVGDEYRVTVGIDALEDVSATLTPLGSVKFEQGSVATRHDAAGLSVNQLFGLYGDIRLFGVLGDGVTNDTESLEALPAGVYHMPDGDYIIDGATLPKTLRFIMSQGARFKAINNPSEINSVIDSINAPIDWKYVGNCKINQYEITVGAGRDFETIQDSIDFVPCNMWQRFVVRVDDGDYSSEHLNADGKIARTTNIDLDNSIPGEHAGLFIVGNTTNPENVKIGSFLAVSCYGATFQPQLSGCEVVSVVPKTNEGASVEFYGCSNGAVLDVKFSADGADKGILAYGGSNVSVENVDFGDQLYNDLVVTKHGSHISSNSNTRLGVGKSPTGTAKRFVSNPISGSIHFNDMSGLKSASFDRVRQGGNMNGFTYNASENTLYGPMQLNDSPSNYQTYFTNIDSFSHAESLVDSTTTIDATKGLNLHCGSVPNAFSQAFIRRDNTLSTQDIIYRQQLKAAVSFPSMVGAFFELGIGFGNGRAYFEVGAVEVRGIFVDFSGVSTNVVICNTSDIVNDKCVFELSVERDNSTVSNQLANVRFKISTKTFETYKAINSVAGSVENTYEWYTKLQSVDGSERDVYIGELSLYRS